jgi:arginine-tRNA-protein transferase
MEHKPLPDIRFFFSTSPGPCPYLQGRVERRVVTELVGCDTVALHNALSLAGYRRSHGIVYVPACPACDACVAVRVVADEFKPSRSQRRILNRNADLIVEELPPIATEEQYDMFAAYQRTKHGDGDMSKMKFADYQGLIEDTPIDTRLLEFRDSQLTLLGACLVDLVDNGLSAVYSFYDLEHNRRSLGAHMILALIERVRETGRKYVYLGFWIADCDKMSYKAAYRPLEARSHQGWGLMAAE